MSDLFDQTCGACIFFREPTEGAPAGTCWRYPPTTLSIPVQAPQAIATPKNAQGGAIQGVMTYPVRPPVSADTLACGELVHPGDLEDDDQPSAA